MVTPYFQKFISPAVALGTKPKFWSSIHTYARVFLSPSRWRVICYHSPLPVAFMFRLSSSWIVDMTNSSGFFVGYFFDNYLFSIRSSIVSFFLKKSPMIALIWSIVIALLPSKALCMIDPDHLTWTEGLPDKLPLLWLEGKGRFPAIVAYRYQNLVHFCKIMTSLILRNLESKRSLAISETLLSNGHLRNI